ncbi:MAG: type IV pilin N-terminal domain-containing protein [Methanoregulaceae archaeon]|nr:type IV pilin N-terminal domain-containing protein [Methanoregulaceae archaeon]
MMGDDNAVSEIVGEMLMLAMVLILLGIFSASVSNYLPEPRDPSVTIMIRYQENPADPGQNVLNLYHKGGDLVRSSDLSIVLENAIGGEQDYVTLLKVESPGVQIIPAGDPEVFDLGDSLRVTNETGCIPPDLRTVRVSTPHAVIFTGRI